MTTETLEKPDTDTTPTDDDDREKFFHYVNKNEMAASAVFGGFVKALCGKEFQVTKAAKKDSPVCPMCKDLYELLPK